jgi:rare lipoprotein A
MAKSPIDNFELEGASKHDEHQLRVLLVEDNPVQQMCIAHLLKNLGHSVNVAAGGSEALSEVQADRNYDVILMDCQMPMMDGFQATRLIREVERTTGQKTAIIGIGAAASPDQCFMAGMDDYLCKPLNKLLVREVLGRWLKDKKVRGSQSLHKDNLATVMLLAMIFWSASQLPVSAKSTYLAAGTTKDGAKANTPLTLSAKIGSKTHKIMPRKLLSGIASWYGMPFHGRRTASGQLYDMNKMTAAHLTLPLSSQVLVENPRNGKVVVITVTDRGPYIKNRVIDLSRAAAKQLGILSNGVAFVNYSVLPTPAQVVSRSSTAGDDRSISALPQKTTE